MRKFPLINLEDIRKEFDYFLLDSSALINYLNVQDPYGSNLKNRISHKDLEADSYVLFNKYFKKRGNFFVTNQIYDELLQGKLHFENIEGDHIKGILSKNEKNGICKKELMYYGKVCLVHKELTQLLKKIKKNEKIINLNEEEKKMYLEFNKRNKSLRKTNKDTLSKLSGPDYNLLITGAVLSMTRGKTAIISNDFHLLRSYRWFTEDENIDQDKFGCFKRDKRVFLVKYKSNNS